MYSTFEIVLFEVSEASSSTENLRLDDVLHLLLLSELLRNQICFLSVECYITKRNGHLVFEEQLASLVFVQFHASHWKIFILDESFV